MKGGLQAGLDAFFLTGLEQLFHEVTLDHGIAAGNRNASSGAFIISPVFQDDLHALLHGHPFAPLLHRFGRAFPCARQAVQAFFPVDRGQLASIELENVATGAGIQAGAALFLRNAFAFIDARLDMRRPALGIAAPSASQRASLQKDLCSQPGAIMNRESLNVKNHSLLTHRLTSFGIVFRVSFTVR